MGCLFLRLPEQPGIGHGLTDNCQLSHVDVECTAVSSACTDDYIIDYTAYDMCGNSTSIQQIVVTADRTGPEFTLAPGDLTLECDDSLTGVHMNSVLCGSGVHPGRWASR